MRPSIKYVVIPGYVESASDGQRHYIGALRLMELYGVDPRECYIDEPAAWWPPSFWRWRQKAARGLIALRPRRDGNYTLPQGNQA